MVKFSFDVTELKFSHVKKNRPNKDMMGQGHGF